jgi:UDP-glucuronate decarboxylase
MHPNDGRVVSNFIMQALEGRDVTIYGDGQQTRSFCYVDDLVDGLIRLMDSERGFTGPVNLGNPLEFSMEELARQVLDLTGSTSKIIHRPLPLDDPRQRRPDISLAEEKLGWKPVTELREGLIRTIAHFEDLRRSLAMV